MVGRKEIVVNFLYYVKNIEVKRAEDTYIENELHINKVFDLLGDDVMIEILKFARKDV